jgi:hypothetical protein
LSHFSFQEGNAAAYIFIEKHTHTRLSLFFAQMNSERNFIRSLIKVSGQEMSVVWVMMGGLLIENMSNLTLFWGLSFINVLALIKSRLN